jgi:phage/plasmid-like protein (TIGR03299 family)
MSHEISLTGGVAHMADSQMDAEGRVSAWHKLGTPVGHAMTGTEALEAAKLNDWNVRTVPLWADVSRDQAAKQAAAAGLPQERGLLFEDEFGVVFTNPVDGLVRKIGTVGKKYTPIQMEDVVDYAEAVVDEGGAHFETAGSLRNYSQTFLTLKLPRTMVLRGLDGSEDTSEWYVSFFNSHDGSSALTSTISSIRTVCANTQDANIKGAKSTFKIQHSKNWGNKIALAREALGLFFVYEEAFETAVQALFEQPFTSDQMVGFATDLTKLDKVEKNSVAATRRQNEVDMLTALFNNSPTIAGTPIAGTKWAAYNAVSEYQDHIAGVRGAGDDQEAQAILRATRTLSQVSSGTSGLKNDAWALLTV